jgi:hypothetical protein
VSDFADASVPKPPIRSGSNLLKGLADTGNSVMDQIAFAQLLD